MYKVGDEVYIITKDIFQGKFGIIQEIHVKDKIISEIFTNSGGGHYGVIIGNSSYGFWGFELMPASLASKPLFHLIDPK